jgi:hypothetical protein
VSGGSGIVYGGGGSGTSTGLGNMNGAVLVPPTVTVTAVPMECYYLREFIKYGANNDPVEVKKLQIFLNVFEGAHLDVSGFYDLATFNATVAFQNKYKTNVLDPWGGTTPGFVYLTTRKQVNEIYCQTAFPLDGNQTMEVNAWRAMMESLREQGISVPQQGGEVLGAATAEANAAQNEELASSTQTQNENVASGTEKILPVTNRGAFANMLGSAYSSISGDIASNWFTLLIYLLLIPAAWYAIILSKTMEEEEESDADAAKEEKK